MPENILQRIRMLVTDADGTLLGRRPEFEQYRAFRQRIDELRTRYGTSWVVCTGRGLRSFNRVFRPMRTFGIVPDYVIVRHAYIYEKAAIGYKPHWLWNMRILLLQWQDKWEVRRAIPILKRAVLSQNPFAHVVYRSGSRICFRFDDDAAAAFGAEILKTASRPYKYLQVFHHVREVDVRTIPFTKGLAVGELARHLSMPPAHVLVVGDGHNDISMMEMHPDVHTACPSNAAAEVVDVVHRTHGHIASDHSLDGVMEILAAYETGTLRDTRPESWHPDHEVANPFAPRREGDSLRDKLSGALLFVAALYTTMAVLASFDMMPFGNAILRPFHAVVTWIARLVGH